MICPKCETIMESIGYGDTYCPKCGQYEYTESKMDFYDRIFGNTLREDQNEKSDDN